MLARYAPHHSEFLLAATLLNRLTVAASVQIDILDITDSLEISLLDYTSHRIDMTSQHVDAFNATSLFRVRQRWRPDR